ncbi:hypothetical protein GCM10009789_35490 [Kribbella sancticallisti]|uniref:SCP2 domain-containing protein n=1 Tax=Kribbella sancticallisti TaxID=460087 RepID=A0ABN2DJY3_9ACTN
MVLGDGIPSAGPAPETARTHRFDYPTYSRIGARAGGWLLIEHGDAEICETHPGGPEDLVVVVNDSLAFARWHLGQLPWAAALRSGAIEVHGSPALARALPTWNKCVEAPLAQPTPTP